MTLRLGELCAGYNGLGMAVEEVFGATPAWFSEYDAAPSKILAHHYPNVPNYGDMTAIDWAGIEQVDIISGGTPCQDLSAAGRRKGMTEGTRSNLWVQMREAIAIQRPRYVVWENVRGAFSAKAASDLEHCPRCMGETGHGGPDLRALGRVLGDLSDLGFDAEWRGVRASEVGACHQRYRVFVLAKNADPAAWSERRISAPGQAESRGSRADTGGRSGASTVADSDRGNDDGRFDDSQWSAQWREATSGRGQGLSGIAAAYRAGYERGWAEAIAHSSRPTLGEHTRGSLAEKARPGSSYRPGDPDRERLTGDRREAEATSDTMRGRSGGGSSEPEPARSDHATFGSDPRGTNWGEYAPAIRRWEGVLGRRAPRPTEPTGRAGAERLSPRFTEWMMGLPGGWVTDPAIGISRNEQLKACGNGVVPQQAKAALRDMLAAFEMEKVA